MGKPTLTPITENSFVDGSVVFANDAAIKGEIEGNIELSNIAESKNLYTMCVGPIYFGPNKSTTPSDGTFTTADVSILVWETPRELTIHAIQLHVDNRQVGGDTTGNADPLLDSGFVLNNASNVSVYVDYSDSFTGAYTVASGWTTAATFTDTLWDGGGSAPLYATAGETVTFATGSPATIPAQKAVRVALKSEANAGESLVQRTRAVVTVTLYVSEDHVE